MSPTRPFDEPTAPMLPGDSDAPGSDLRPAQALARRMAPKESSGETSCQPDCGRTAEPVRTQNSEAFQRAFDRTCSALLAALGIKVPGQNTKNDPGIRLISAAWRAHSPDFTGSLPEAKRAVGNRQFRPHVKSALGPAQRKPQLVTERVVRDES